MELKKVIAIFLKFFAICLFLYTLNDAANWIPLLADPAYVPAVYFQLASILIVFLLSLFLWFFPLTVASKLLPKTKETKNEVTSISYSDLQTILFTTLGLYLLFNVLSDLVYWGSFLSIYGKSSFDQPLITPYDKAAIFTTVIELILVLLLLFGQSGLKKAFEKLRYGG
jgi:hypothetical protein